MSPKTGRPKVENPKDYRFSIRLDIEMYQKLENYCQKNLITKGEAVRKGIMLLLAQK